MGIYLSDEQLGQQMFLCSSHIYMSDASRIANAASDHAYALGLKQGRQEVIDWIIKTAPK